MVHPPKTGKESRIFDAALLTITEKGFHRTRMSDIARKAGISYGLVYHYFKNKEALFDAILDRWWRGLFALMEALREGEDGVRAKLRRLTTYFLDAYQERPELVTIFITEISRSTANLTEHRLKCFTDFMDLTEAFILQGQQTGTLRRDLRARYLTYIYLGAIETLLTTMVFGGETLKGEAQKERMVETLLEVFFNGAAGRDTIEAGSVAHSPGCARGPSGV